MTMKRRGFLGALLASPVAAKAAADAGISEGPSAFGQVAECFNEWEYAAQPSDPAKEVADLYERLGKVAGKRARIRNEVRHEVRRLDPDLATNRSMSLGCKMMLQTEREVERAMASERSWIERQIADILSPKDRP